MSRQHFSLSSIYSELAAKQECEVWGCELSSSCRKFVFDVEDDFRVHLLGLWTICIGNAEDELHLIAVEGDQTQWQQVTVAALRPSLLPMVNVNGLEITPPVSFLLTSGSGPVYISGQHMMLHDFDLSQEENGSLGSAGEQPPDVCCHDAFKKGNYRSSEDLCATLVAADRQKDDSDEEQSSV
ncbi:nucleoplasmin-like isoform X2 [Eleutherodactylus coqui]|uniref:nucleoplasmin-like isoform X2 n=1 Tax=Eleutherodactylus coqui TaxID=57060 RepID=UPI00346374AC